MATMYQEQHYVFIAVFLASILATISSEEAVDKIRLVGGSGPYEGRVEIFHGGRWGTVCRKYAPELYSKICLQMGYDAGRSIVTSSDVFGPGTGWKWTDVKFCDGSFGRGFPCIDSTAGEPDGTGCEHKFDIGLICDASTRNPPPVRLVEYRNENGYLWGNIPEVQFGGTWGGICISGDFEVQHRLISVICRQLGYSGGPTAASFRHVRPPANRTLWFDYTECDEEFARIDQCYFTVGLMGTLGEEKCRNSTYLMECEATLKNRDPSPPAPLRLVGGNASSEGRVEIYQNGTWGTICVGENQVWGQAEAARVCRQLGYHSYIDTEQQKYVDKGISQPTSADIFGGKSESKIWLDSVKCDPKQAENPALEFLSYTPAFALKDCDRSEWGGSGVCDQDNDVGVVCAVKYTEPPPIRLTGGKWPHVGRLEVYFQDEWGTVCFDKDWDYQHLPDTVCKQLGFNSTVGLTRQFGSGEGRIWLQNITCVKDDTRVDTCRHTRWGKRATCDHSMDVGIKCGASRISSPSAIILGLVVSFFITLLHGKIGLDM